jgi:hypothetical protein
MSAWTYTILENYCCFSWMSKAEHECLDEKGKTEVYKNKSFLLPKLRPKWCVKHNRKRLPSFKCMSYGKNDEKCPFFGYCEAGKKEYRVLEKGMREEWSKQQ